MQPKCVHKCQHMHMYAVHNHQGYLESAHSVCCFILPLSNSLTLLCMYVCVCREMHGAADFQQLC